MPQAVFIHDGCCLDYTPPVDLPTGEVIVQGELVGVTKQPIKANQLGALATDGVFDFAKNTGVAFTAGAFVYWDDVANVAVASAGGGAKLLGKAVRAALATDTTVRVRLLQ